MVRLAVERVGPDFCGGWGLLRGGERFLISTSLSIFLSTWWVCGGWGLLRGGELFLISTSLSIFLSTWWVWLCLTFRPVRLRLLRPTRFCWLLRSLKDRRSLISHFLLLYGSSNRGSCQEPIGAFCNSWLELSSKILTLKVPITTIVVCFVFCLWF